MMLIKELEIGQDLTGKWALTECLAVISDPDEWLAANQELVERYHQLSLAVPLESAWRTAGTFAGMFGAGWIKFYAAEEDGGLLAGQIYTTVNFRTGFWGRLVCLGAEYQIEHHLLPEANPLKMRRISPIVEAFCRRHHYPYRQLGWAEGVVKSLRIVRHPKPVYRLGDLLGELG